MDRRRRKSFPALTGYFCAALAAHLFLLASASPQDIGTPPAEPEALIQWLAQHWTSDGWKDNPDNDYMRTSDDAGWKARMLAMRQLVLAGDKAVPALTAALASDDDELKIFAAQTFGFLPRLSPTAALIEQLKSGPNAAVRLYAVDALGRKGGSELHTLFEQQLAAEKNRDVKKHLNYAIERQGAAVDSTVIQTLSEWDPDRIDSAVVGEPAPDFELDSLSGKTIRLKDFRGKSAVVLVFIYGDT